MVAVASRTENLKLIISGDGKLLGTELGKSEGRIRQYESRVGSIFTKLGRRIGSTFKRMATNPLALLGGTAAVLYAGKQLVDFEDKLSTVRINAGLTGREFFNLREHINRMAFTTGKSRTEIVAAISDIYDKTGDFRFAAAAIEGTATASTAMSAEMSASSRVLSSMRLGMKVTAGEAMELFDVMARMGNIGSFTFAQQAQQAERLFSSGTMALGINKKNFAEYAAFLQSVKPIFGTPDLAATAIERIMMVMKIKRKEIEKAVHFKLFDEKGAIIDFEKAIKAVSKLSIPRQAKLFGEFSRAFLPLASEEGIKTYEKYIAEGQRAGFVAEAFARKQGDAKFQLNALAATAERFADAGLSPLIKQLTEDFKKFTSDPAKMAEFQNNLQAISEVMGGLAKALGWVVDKYVKFYEFNKKLNLGGFAYQITHPKAIEERGKSAVEGFNALPREQRSAMIAGLNKTGRVNIGAPQVNNAVNINVKTERDPGRIDVSTDDRNTVVSTSNRGSLE